MNHNFKSGKRATSRLLGWLPREAKPLVHGIWRLAWNKVQWHQSKVKQKRFTDPTFSHTTQCRNTLCKLWQPFRWNCVFHSCVATVILDMYRDVQITIYSHLMAPLLQVASFASRTRRQVSDPKPPLPPCNVEHTFSMSREIWKENQTIPLFVVTTHHVTGRAHRVLTYNLSAYSNIALGGRGFNPAIVAQLLQRLHPRPLQRAGLASQAYHPWNPAAWQTLRSTCHTV